MYVGKAEEKCGELAPFVATTSQLYSHQRNRNNLESLMNCQDLTSPHGLPKITVLCSATIGDGGVWRSDSADAFEILCNPHSLESMVANLSNITKLN